MGKVGKKTKHKSHYTVHRALDLHVDIITKPIKDEILIKEGEHLHRIATLRAKPKIILQVQHFMMQARL